MTSFPVLKHQAEVLGGVAPFLHSNFAKLRELDEEANRLQAQLEKRCEIELVEAQRRAKSGEEATSSALGPDWERLSEVSQRKHDLAYQIYDFLDKSIQKLDTDINALGNEIDLERETFGLPQLVPPPDPKGNEPAFGTEVDPAAAAAAVAAAEAIGGHVEPNEPLYCVCQQVSFGDMVACENPDCRIEWFHYACVGLRPGERVKGRWFCVECRPLMAQRQRETRLGLGKK